MAAAVTKRRGAEPRAFSGGRWADELDPKTPTFSSSNRLAVSDWRRGARARRLQPSADYRPDAGSDRHSERAARSRRGVGTCGGSTAGGRRKSASAGSAAGNGTGATVASGCLDSGLLGLARQPAAMGSGPLGGPATSGRDMGAGALGKAG